MRSFSLSQPKIERIEMHCCKKCRGEEVVKNGHIRGQQRYKCKGCGCSFILGDKRAKPESAAKRALAVILYALGKASYGFIAKLFGVTRAAVLKWIRKEGARIDKPKIPSNIKEMEFDEMWHFIGSKKTSYGSSKPWIVLQEKLLHGCSVVVALQRSENCIAKSVT